MAGEEWRAELDSHKGDPYAHPAMVARFMLDHSEEMVAMKADQTLLGNRLTSVEKFAEQVKGGAIVIGALVGGGLLVLIGHLSGLPV